MITLRVMLQTKSSTIPLEVQLSDLHPGVIDVRLGDNFEGWLPRRTLLSFILGLVSLLTGPNKEKKNEHG